VQEKERGKVNLGTLKGFSLFSLFFTLFFFIHYPFTLNFIESGIAVRRELEKDMD
jgi:hypothetical protein